MIKFFKFFFWFLVFSEFFNFFFLYDNFDYNFHYFYFFIFLLFIYINFFFNDAGVEIPINFDLLFKFFVFLLKTPNFFLNYIINILKKIFLYLIHFKYIQIINTTKILNKQYTKFFFIWWKPLFKKTSYFGYFRSNRSKWIK